MVTALQEHYIKTHSLDQAQKIHISNKKTKTIE